MKFGADDGQAAGLGHAALASVLMIAVITPVPLVACAGRGYLPPLGAALAGAPLANDPVWAPVGIGRESALIDEPGVRRLAVDHRLRG